jgi:hypothetical protein
LTEKHLSLNADGRFCAFNRALAGHYQGVGWALPGPKPGSRWLKESLLLLRVLSPSLFSTSGTLPESGAKKPRLTWRLREGGRASAQPSASVFA